VAPIRLELPVERPAAGARAQQPLAAGAGPTLGETARRTFVVAVVVVAVLAGALALWQLRVVLALVFLAMIIAAAMRPGVEALRRHGVPRGVGIALHYLGLAGFVLLLGWLALPRALAQVDAALGGVPTSTAQLHRAAVHSTGIKHAILTALEKRLKRLSGFDSLLHPALSITTTAFEVLVAIVFVFACSAYWIYERERAIDLVTSLMPRQKRKTARDTFDLIDAKLGAFVRGEILLVLFVSTVLSLALWAVGEPYWILIGPFAGIFELVPVIGPLVAGALAVGIGLTVSWHVALAAGVAILAVRVLEDYVVTPRLLGHAVGLSPFLVLVSVLAVEVLFGGVAVLLAIPIAAVVATVVNVTVRGRDPAEEGVPAVLFSSQDAE
jgi:predicted PurR-regulated permease PerM